jgi:sugar transferase (PEP-CTERM/EpsH1 system associated)
MRVLYLTHRVPYAPDRGDRIRSYHTLQFLRAAGVAVHVIAFAHDRAEYDAGKLLASFVSGHDVLLLPRARNLVRGGLALPTSRPLTHVLLDAPAMQPTIERVCTHFAPTIVVAFCSGMARFAMTPPLSRLPFVLDMVDLDSVKWAELSRSAAPPLRWLYAREHGCLAGFEAAAVRAAAATLVVTGRERAEVQALSPGLDAEVVGNGVDVGYFKRPPTAPSAGPEAVFTGVFSYAPNAAGAEWLIDRVWPIVQARRADARLTLVGAAPPARLQRLANRFSTITVTGRVDDVRPFLWRSRVAVAPLHTARGLQNKVLEALAAGLNAVVTPQVAAGLPADVQLACHVAAEPEAFADAVVTALDETPDRPLDLATMDWHHALRPLLDILEKVSHS